MTHRYEKRFGSYYCYWDDKLSFMADEVALAFDADPATPCLLKHGPKEKVEEWAKEARGKYREAGFGNIEIVVVSSSGWDCDELNKMLQGVGVARFLVGLTVKGGACGG